MVYTYKPSKSADTFIKRLDETIKSIASSGLEEANTSSEYEIVSFDYYHTQLMDMTFHNKKDKCSSFGIYGWKYIFRNSDVYPVNYRTKEISHKYIMDVMMDYLKKQTDFKVIRGDFNISLKKNIASVYKEINYYKHYDTPHEKIIDMLHSITTECLMDISSNDKEYEIASFDVLDNKKMIMKYNNKKGACTGFCAFGFSYMIRDYPTSYIDYGNYEITPTFIMETMANYMRQCPTFHTRFTIVQTDNKLIINRRQT